MRADLRAIGDGLFRDLNTVGNVRRSGAPTFSESALTNRPSAEETVVGMKTGTLSRPTDSNGKKATRIPQADHSRGVTWVARASATPQGNKRFAKTLAQTQGSNCCRLAYFWLIAR